MNQKFESIPQHIAIIMDGNGRWAKKRMLPRVAGHKRGVEVVKTVTKRANELGVKIITLYAFSTENWGRPDDEVSFLMKLPKVFFNSFIPELLENNVKIECIGDLSKLPLETQNVLQSAMDKTSHCTGLILNFALNYGGKVELVEAIKEIAQAYKNDQISLEDINGTLVDRSLMTGRYGELANPDLIIRTSGELRLSNFLLWQSAYSELYFTPVLWPDFNEDEFDKAILDYNHRQRRYGKVTED